MDDNLSWKSILFGVFFSLIILGLAYWLISPREATFFTEGKSTKIAEFRNLFLSGRREGKSSWKFFAQEGWTSRDKEVTVLSGVKHGQIFSGQAEPLVTQLSALEMKVWPRTEVIEASGRIKTKFNLGKNGKKDWATITGRQLKYLNADKRTEISGEVSLVKKDAVIHTDKMIIYHQDKTADLQGAVRLRRRSGRLLADSLRYFNEEERLIAERHVRLSIIDGKQKTAVRANLIAFYLDPAKEMRFSGSVEVDQGRNIAQGQEGSYLEKTKEVGLKHHVKAIFSKSAEAARAKSPTAKEILKGQTLLTADELVFSTQTGNAQANGSVQVRQKGKEAKSDRAAFDDKSDLLVLTGHVYLKQGDRWIQCRQINASVSSESFQAIGSVEAEFKI
jgi:lipopolysaccharide assembly outer membrane protein LptD (OstA)